ncbi:MAG: DUF86 domain-containing protein [Patescibacteria group bacterium]
MTFQESYILEKLSQIAEKIKEVKKFFRFSEEEILADSEKLHVAERLFQLIVDDILDINQHFIKELNFDISEDLQGTFYILGENSVLPKDFAFKIAPVTGVRNILVHQYEKLDEKLFIHTLIKNYSDFEKYIKFILEYLKK